MECTCPKCGSHKYILKGSDRNGKQRVKCIDCGRGYSVDWTVDRKKDKDVYHYSLAPELCTAAKRSISPLFTNNINKVNCRICRKRYNREIMPEDLTSVKSFTLTGKAIKLIKQAAKDSNKSQSAYINDLIISTLGDSKTSD